MTSLIIPHTQHLWLFSLMVFGIIALPGMDMAYVMASALAGGRRSGFAAVAGIVAGGVVHVAMAMLGVGLLLTHYPLAYQLLLGLGALYVAWIGLSVWRGAAALGEIGSTQPLGWSQTFWRGALSCLMNPKAYVFMVAIFPQFVRAEYGPLPMQAVWMGLIIATIQLAVYGSFAWGAGGVQQWLRANPVMQVRIGRGVGLLLILGAVWTASGLL